MDALARLGVQGEVLVADNGSEDGSSVIAEDAGARVVRVVERGYGSALRAGIEAARGHYIIMADADDSYDWSSIDGFVQKLREGYDLVMGCRFRRGGGTILPGAMPWTHRLFGNPALSTMARVGFGCPVTDMYCGMRGFSAEWIRGLQLRAPGMEFAYEMTIKASMAGARITEIPVTLSPDGRSRAPHLRTWRDGWRTLRFMLLFSPTWLFTAPGLFLFVVGALGFGLLLPGPLRAGGVNFDVHTLLVCGLLCQLGFQSISFGVCARAFAVDSGFLPARYATRFQAKHLEAGLMIGAVVVLIGVGLGIAAVVYWGKHDFGNLSYAVGFRIMIPSVTLVSLGVQIIIASFLLSFLTDKNR